MFTFAALLASGFVLALTLRPRVTYRLHPSGSKTGCGEMTLMLSYDRLRLHRGQGGTTLVRRRRNLMLAGYGWSDPQP